MNGDRLRAEMVWTTSVAEPARDAPGPFAGEILAAGIAGSLRTFIICVAICFVAYEVADAVKAFAGKNSIADLSMFVQVLADMKVKAGLAIILTGSGWFYGFRQRHLRRNTIEQLATRNAELELRVDPNRSSSQLTQRGTTRQGD